MTTSPYSTDLRIRVIERIKSGETQISTSRLYKAQLLLKSGATVDTKDKGGFTPLHLAAYDGHQNLTELLLNFKADVEAKSNRNSTPLHMAAREGHAEIIKLLISKGADLKAQTSDSFTPLHIAAEQGHAEIEEVEEARDAKRAKLQAEEVSSSSSSSTNISEFNTRSDDITTWLEFTDDNYDEIFLFGEGG